MKAKCFANYCLFVLLLTVNISVADEVLANSSEPNSEERSVFESMIKEALKDPDSAKFRHMTIVDNKLACVEFNAKNEFGGYVGFKNIVFANTQQLAGEPGGRWVVFSDKVMDLLLSKSSHKECVDLLYSTIKGINEK